MKSILTEIDLAPYGFDQKVSLEGKVIDTFKLNNGLIFLFDENHDYINGIKQSYRNAIHLLDTGIIDFVGVEGFDGNVANKLKKVWPSTVSFSFEMIRERIKNNEISGENLIDAHFGFAQSLALMRSDATIWGIEDADVYRETGKELKAMRKNMSNEVFDGFFKKLSEKAGNLRGRKDNPEDLFKKFINQEFIDEFQEEMMSKTGQSVKGSIQRDRPSIFVKNLFDFWKSRKLKNAVLINAGRKDQDVVSEILRNKKLSSFIRIRPLGLEAFNRNIEKKLKCRQNHIKEVVKKLMEGGRP